MGRPESPLLLHLVRCHCVRKFRCFSEARRKKETGITRVRPFCEEAWRWSMIKSKRFLLFAAPLLAALISPAFAVARVHNSEDQPSREAPSLNDQAVAAAEAGRYPEAIELLKRAIELQPELAVAHYNLGRVYQALNQFANAADAFKEVLLLNPGFTDAHYHLGTVYNKTQHYPEAIKCFKLALQLKPDSADALSGLSFSYSALNRHEEALEACEAAIQLNPALAEAYNNRGVVYFRLGQRAAGIESLEHAQHLEPNRAEFYNNLAICTLMRVE